MSGTDGASDVCGGATPLKVYLQRRKRPSVHRMRGVRTLGELLEIVRGLWAGRGGVVVQYDDEEGDRITVATEREWDEAVRLHAQAVQRAGGREVPLRLLVARPGEVRRAPARMPSTSSDGAVADDDTEWSDVAAGPRPAWAAAGDDDAEPSGIPPAPAPSEVGDEQERHFAREMDRQVLALLSALYECDMAQELLAAEPRVAFGGVLRRSHDAASGRVEVDVDLEELAGAVGVAAMSLLDGLETVRAAELLELGCAVFPGDAVMRYSSGCALAMSGRRDAAILALEEAVRRGYRDADRMERDPDLASLQAEERFRLLVLRVRGGSTVRVAPPALSAAVQTLLAVFPALGAAEAEAVLRRCGWSAQAAVHELLGGV